jgi:hypothetical protein
MGRVGDRMMVKPRSGDELFLGLENGIITFTGNVRKVFTTEIN